MISNVWEKLELYCGNGHEEKAVAMEINQKRSGVVYACPCCENFLTVKDVEKMLDRVADVINSADAENEMLDIKNLSFRVGQCDYRVIDNGAKMKVMGNNRKARSI